MLTIIADTDHDGRYLLQGRVTKDGDLVLRFVVRVVVDDVRDGVAYAFVAGTFGFVASHLGVRQYLKREVEHICRRPHFLAVGCIIIVILTRRRQMQRDLVFVVVIPEVRTQTDEAGQIAVFQLRIDTAHLLGVDEHLQVLVLPHVVSRVLIHRPGIMRREVHDPHHHRLLVLRNQLCLTRIGLPAHTRR